MNAIIAAAGFLFRIVIARVSEPRNIFGRLAALSLILAASAVIVPWWQALAESLGQNAEAKLAGIPAGWIACAFFTMLSLIFAALAYRTRVASQADGLVHSPLRSRRFSVGPSAVVVFCGSVEFLDAMDVIITSENRELTLGVMNGTSVSGRVRRMAASRGPLGETLSDPLFDHVEAWKQAQGSRGPFALGTTVPAPPFALASRGVKAILLAIALEIRDSGDNAVQASSIDTIIRGALDYCDAHGYKSIFIPVFGLGGGGVAAAEAAEATVAPLVRQLKARPESYEVLLGTYRLSHAAHVSVRIAVPRG